MTFAHSHTWIIQPNKYRCESNKLDFNGQHCWTNFVFFHLWNLMRMLKLIGEQYFHLFWRLWAFYAFHLLSQTSEPDLDRWICAFWKWMRQLFGGKISNKRALKSTHIAQGFVIIFTNPLHLKSIGPTFHVHKTNEILAKNLSASRIILFFTSRQTLQLKWTASILGKKILKCF